MVAALVIVLGLIALYGYYRIRAAWSPFTSKGRRRVIYWGRGWWSGGTSENRDEY